MTKHLIGLYKRVEDFMSAAGRLKKAGFDQMELMSPLPLEETEKVLGKQRAALRYFALFGGIVGGLSGFLLASSTALVFILPQGGRPIITFPPFLVITYELTILLGVLSTLVGFFLAAKLPAWLDRPYAPETNVDRFGVHVACAENQMQEVRKIMRQYGAEEVREWRKR